jgi:hypothetical protein
MSREEVWSYIESAPFTGATALDTVTEAEVKTKTTKPPRLADLKPRADAPPL